MDLKPKILILMACAFGFTCTLGALLTDREIFFHEYMAKEYRAVVACTILSMLVFTGIAILHLCTLRPWCSDKVVGIVGATAGLLACALTICAYCDFYDRDGFGHRKLPTTPEWLFGAMTTGCGLLMASIVFVFSKRGHENQT